MSVGVLLRSLVVFAALPFAAVAADSETPTQTLQQESPVLELPSVADTGAVDFDLPQPVLDLGPSVSLRRVVDPADPSGAWFTLGVQYRGTATVARVLAAS